MHTGESFLTNRKVQSKTTWPHIGREAREGETFVNHIFEKGMCNWNMQIKRQQNATTGAQVPDTTTVGDTQPR